MSWCSPTWRSGPSTSASGSDKPPKRLYMPPPATRSRPRMQSRRNRYRYRNRNALALGHENRGARAPRLLASRSVPLNIAKGNGKTAEPDRMAAMPSRFGKRGCSVRAPDCGYGIDSDSDSGPGPDSDPDPDFDPDLRLGRRWRAACPSPAIPIHPTSL